MVRREDNGQLLLPVLLTLIDMIAKRLHQDLIHPLHLSLSRRVVRRPERFVRPEQLADLFGQFGGEIGSTIGK